MAKFLGQDIPRRVERKFRGKLARAVLYKLVDAAPTMGSLTRPAPPARTAHACFGFLEDWPGEFPSQASTRDNTRVARVDMMATIIGRSIRGGVVPTPGDELRINNVTYRIMKVNHDPTASVGVAASYKLTMRGI